MRHALHMARRVATTPLRALLLTGEAGTGKELVARCIHNAGLNANAPFVSINCASIPAPLLEVELFGLAPSRNDAAAGASSARWSWPVAARCSSTRSARCRSRCRIGCSAASRSTASRASAAVKSVVHCRVIAASKTRLEDRVAAGAFRDDLLARLAVLRIELPPLREREDDARLIADHLLAETARLQATPRRQIGSRCASRCSARTAGRATFAS